MKRADFHYSLPDELIARYPLPERTASRLMCLNGGNAEISHRRFTDLLELLRPDDLLVFNDSRVIPARMWGQKPSGGKLEVLVERITGNSECLAQVRASKPPRPGATLWLRSDPASNAVDARMQVLGREGDLFALRLSGKGSLLQTLRDIGHMPLPPYIGRADEAMDWERYQTVYGSREGSVAAPTAGLHFDREFIERCRERGVGIGFVTLHVGAGTFQPVRTENIEDHSMHAEYLEVSAELCRQVRRSHSRGGRVIAVGTTALRSLESAAGQGELAPFQGDSKLFIYPGYEFKVVDALITNFHLPESTLIMLVSAFAGRPLVLRAYLEAIAERYRFFSYGDAMFVLPARR